MTAPAPVPIARERRAYVHSTLLGGVDLLAAQYRHHVFPRHAQDQVVLGMVERGHIRFQGGGLDTSIGEGDILFISPGTVHEALGHADDAWTYRALYLTPDQWLEGCASAGVREPGGASVLRDAGLHEQMRRLHKRLITGGVSERGLQLTIRRFADAVAIHQSPASSRTGTPHHEDGLARVRRTLDESGDRRVTLREMASLAGLSRFHFLRAFSRAYGVSPYAYSLNRRLQEAQRRLAAGHPIAMTALDVGFADQAHLTRHFLRTIGVTPGEYQRAFT